MNFPLKLLFKTLQQKIYIEFFYVLFWRNVQSRLIGKKKSKQTKFTKKKLEMLDEKRETPDYFSHFMKNVFHEKLPKPSRAFFKAYPLGLTLLRK